MVNKCLGIFEYAIGSAGMDLQKSCCKILELIIQAIGYEDLKGTYFTQDLSIDYAKRPSILFQQLKSIKRLLRFFALI